MPLVAGTLTTSAVALALAVPVGTIGAIYLSEFASHKTREITKPILELLVGVPTIAFGYFALLFVTPLLQKIYPDLPGFNMLSAGSVSYTHLDVYKRQVRTFTHAHRHGTHGIFCHRGNVWNNHYAHH